MTKLDVSKIDLSLYPLVGSYRYPQSDSLAAPLTEALGVKGVFVSAEPRGASWASFAMPTPGPFPEKELVARMRVHGLAADKKLGEALIVSYVLLDGDTIVAVSEDHAFKPPRPARLALVDASGTPVPLTDPLREAVAKIATAPPAKAKPAKSKPQESKPQESKPQESKPQESKPAKAAKPAAASPAASSERFVFDFPLVHLAVSAQGDRIATAHAQSGRVHVFTLDGVPCGEAEASAGAMTGIRAPAFSPDGARLALGAVDVRIVEVASGKELAKLELAKKLEVSSITWTPEGLFVSALTPKSSIFVHLDPATLAERARHEWKREPGMPRVPMLDGSFAHLVFDGVGPGAIGRLDLASGKLERVDVGDRFSDTFGLEGVTREGLWVRADDGKTSPLHLLDRRSYATLKKVQIVSAGPFAFAGDGAGFAASMPSPDADAIAWHDGAGKERARFEHTLVPALDTRLASLAKARQSKASLRYLRHEASASTQALALAGDAIVAATEWSIAVHGRDGSLRAATNG